MISIRIYPNLEDIDIHISGAMAYIGISFTGAKKFTVMKGDMRIL